MRRPRHMFLRALALIALVVSSLGFLAMPAAAAPQAQERPAPEMAQAGTGTVTVSKYVCDGLSGVVWNGTVGDTCVAGTATLDFYLYGDGTDASWPLTVNGTGSIDLAAGTYQVIERGTWSRIDIEVTAGGTTAISLQNPSGNPLPGPDPDPDPDPAPVPVYGSVQVDKFYCPGVTTVSFDPSLVGDDCWRGDATMAFYLYGDGTDEYWPLSLGADGVGVIDLVVGTYAMVEQGTYTQLDVTVTEGAVTYVTVVNPGGDAPPEPAPAPGYVDILKLYCEDAETAFFVGGDDDIGDDCVTGPATFTFYLVGDGTDDNWQVTVWEDGFGWIELAPGTYEVWEEGTGIMTTIEVVSDEVAFLTAVNPGAAPAPRDGTVNLSVFHCTNITETQFNSDGFSTIMAAGLPTFEPACDPGTGTLTFYLVGDGTADYWQTTVNGTGSIVLAPGTYEVIEEGTQASTFITVYAGDFINLDVLIPTGEYEPGSSVNVVKFYCDTVTEVEFLSFSGSEYSDRDEPWGAPDCVSGPATFTFYLVGDGTADYAQLHVHGSGTIGLEPGIYEVVEEGTQASFEFEVFENDNTMLVVNNPMPDDGHVPDHDDDDDNGDTPAKPGDKKHTTSSGGVTKLPSTGSGMADSTGVLALAAAAASAIAGAGALTLRKKG